MIINKQPRFFSLPLLLAGLCFSSYGHARAVLEEVIVTAQHREQSLQDVPVSVSAISGAKMIEAGINRLEDLQAYVPNLTVTESGISTDIFIRGIGSGMNQGFEQSVGMYVDGIYYGRAQLARAPFLDLSRAEVLRGPQNILHGKNSIAGAVNLHTADPTEEFEGMVSGLYEPNFDERVFDLVLSGPVTDKVGVRFATRLRDYGGYVENLTLDRFGPQYDQQTFRLKVKWDVSDE
ncbi:MAG: iron complex outermembrane receptor protein, partial [Bermanella sp.]